MRIKSQLLQVKKQVLKTVMEKHFVRTEPAYLC